jgi:hypothetical protein
VRAVSVCLSMSFVQNFTSVATEVFAQKMNRVAVSVVDNSYLSTDSVSQRNIITGIDTAVR